jgi:hypothetical protein
MVTTKYIITTVNLVIVDLEIVNNSGGYLRYSLGCNNLFDTILDAETHIETLEVGNYHISEIKIKA